MPLLLRASLVLQALGVLGSLACSEPDRSFAEGNGGGTTGTSGSTSSSPSTGTEGTTSAGGGPGSGGAATSSAAGALCGNGAVDEGEECDEDTDLCGGCLFQCPGGWLRAGDSCFAVALGDVVQVEGLEGLARCGALDPAGARRRAHPATPATTEQFAALAAACPANGCWLGYLALGDPSTGDFVAPSTGEALFAEAPWDAAQPSRGVREVCTRLRSTGGADPQPILEDVDCVAETAYSACELELGWGSQEDCGNGALDGDEECDGPAEEDCVSCDRACREDQVEDPRTHACLFSNKTNVSFAEAGGACLTIRAGSDRATPDEIADVRVPQLVGGGWLGLQVSQTPSWQSGEAYTYQTGQYPLGNMEGAEGFAGYLGDDGFIGWADPNGGETFPALCEIHQPG